MADAISPGACPISAHASPEKTDRGLNSLGKHWAFRARPEIGVHGLFRDTHSRDSTTGMHTLTPGIVEEAPRAPAAPKVRRYVRRDLERRATGPRLGSTTRARLLPAS